VTTSPSPAAAKRAVLYLRVSSRGQVDTDYDPEGISLPAQRAVCERRAAELGAEIIAEYVEPGRTAKTTDNRPEFQKMMARIKARQDVDYVIVYARSRMHRNAIDAAITKRDLRTAGAQLVSVTDYTEDSAVGNMVATILDAVNQYQSEASGADIAYKMGQKASIGGTLGLAPIGYLNVRERVEGREIRAVVIDPVRGPLVRMAFELYATGTYSFPALAEALTDAGLRTRPTKRYPAGTPISLNTIGKMLRDRYYLGYVNHKGTEYKGRHEPLVSHEVFARVQEVLFNQRGAGTRARTHHHYLKGTLWCQRCKRRLIIMRGKSKSGTLYFYFICRGRQDRTCDLPYLPVLDVEKAVADHYAAVALPAELRRRITAGMDAALADTTVTMGAVRDQIKKQIAKLDTQEDAFLDLVGDPDWPKEKITKRLRSIRDERTRLEHQLARTEQPDLDSGRAALATLLELLTQPQELYRLATDNARRTLNQAFFHRLYLDADEAEKEPAVAADEPTEPIAPLLHVHRAGTRNSGSAVMDTAADTTSTLLATALAEPCSSNAAWVEVAGIEPASFNPKKRLLRAQPAVLFSAPAITQASRRRAQPLSGFPIGSVAESTG
jgi:site-specific DNA recombinase